MTSHRDSLRDFDSARRKAFIQGKRIDGRITSFLQLDSGIFSILQILFKIA